MNEKFCASELSELIALQRLFREAKFSTDPDDAELCDSPLVARMFERLMSALVVKDVQTSGEQAKRRWEAWLAIDETRDEWRSAVRSAARDFRWASFSDSERIAQAYLLLSPFTTTPTLVERFIVEANEARNRQASQAE